MPLRRPVNDRQLDLLRRVANAREPVTSAEPTLATTVYALRARGLLRTERRDGGWAAILTHDGAFFAQHERYPPPERNGQLHARAGRPAGVAAPASPPPRTRPVAEQVTRAAPEVAAPVSVPTHTGRTSDPCGDPDGGREAPPRRDRATESP